jgi:hypothetical protein
MAGEVANNVQIFPSAARTTTAQGTSGDISVPLAAQIDIILDMTVNAGGAGSVTLTVNAKDPISGKYYALLTGAAVVSVSTNVYKIGRGLTAAANSIVNSGIPATLQFIATANNANPTTWSLAINVMPV